MTLQRVMDEEGSVRLLASILEKSPRLSGALCQDRPDLWDDQGIEGDAEEAAEICGQCPALAACRQWADSVPRRHVSGVVAGTYRPFAAPNLARWRYA